VAVHNLVWPVLFNIFAIRGEEYRDPRVLLTGIDHLLALGAEHLVAAHGPPMSGAADIRRRVTRYRDSIQFLWDQSVRHINRGVLAADLGHVISLPDQYDDDFSTAERYGVSEHHVRQIRNGLFGFFDGDESQLFPLPSIERGDRLIAGFGGRAKVRSLVVDAIDTDDIRWATEMATWLVRSSGAEQDDRNLLARALRIIGQRSSAANIRSWCLTRALSLEGTIDTSRLYQHRFGRQQVLSSPLERSVHVLRVLVDPELLGDVDVHVGWDIGSGVSTGLHFRNGIACPTDGTGCSSVLRCTIENWADLLTGRATLSALMETGAVSITGDETSTLVALRACDPEGLRS
jgi:alkyl sulfatase BDS1-like metallo-beta-lactamase superfamily hydrolase